MNSLYQALTCCGCSSRPNILYAKLCAPCITTGEILFLNYLLYCIYITTRYTIGWLSTTSHSFTTHYSILSQFMASVVPLDPLMKSILFLTRSHWHSFLTYDLCCFLYHTDPDLMVMVLSLPPFRGWLVVLSPFLLFLLPSLTCKGCSCSGFTGVFSLYSLSPPCLK